MSEGMHHDLLDDPLISLRGADGAVGAHTLPGVLAALSSGDLFGDFPALQAHQHHPWYALLVQLAAIALHRADRATPPADPAEWRAHLRALTQGRLEPWCLIVDDPAQPAFLQAPAPDLATFKSDLSHPDELDILITSKNHDVKALRIGDPRPEHWLFALVMLQTMQGYAGSGYYGIARMNGAFGNRPAVGHQPSLGWGARFRRDVTGLLAARERLLDEYGYRDDGIALLWDAPWDRATSLSLGDLDPFFVEICQAARLVERGDAIGARKTTHQAARVDAKAQFGRTGDPWTPIDSAAEKSLTLSAAGFTYAKVVDLLDSGTYVAGPLGGRLPGDPGGLWFSAWALVRGKGETNGMHRRRIPIPPSAARSFFSSPDAQAQLIAAARRRVELAGEMRKRVLGPALGRLRGADGDSKSQVIGQLTEQCLARFESRVDDAFFAALWADAETGLDDTPWRERLVDLARGVLNEALDSAPLPAARRYRAIAAAEGRFFGGARKFCPSAFADGSTRDQTDEEEAIHG